MSRTLCCSAAGSAVWWDPDPDSQEIYCQESFRELFFLLTPTNRGLKLSVRLIRVLIEKRRVPGTAVTAEYSRFSVGNGAVHGG